MTFRYHILKFLFLFTCCSMAQVHPNFVQFYNNKLFFSPTVFSDDLNFGLSYKSQFVGIDGAPTILSADVEYPFNEKSSIGLVLLNDRQGNENNFFKKISTAYKLKLSEDNFIVFGISANLFYQSIFRDNWVAPQDNKDENILNISDTSMGYNFGLGVSYQWKRYIISLSLSDLLESSIKMNGYNYKKSRYYYLMMESIFELNHNFYLEPALLFSTNLKTYSMDLSTVLSLYDVFKLGISYRLYDSIGLIMGYQMIDNINIMYSYDYGVFNRYNSYGSHEVTLKFRFNHQEIKRTDIKKVENIRFL